MYNENLNTEARDAQSKLRMLWIAGIIILIIFGCAWSCTEDYKDAVFIEMLDNGSYNTIKAAHPDYNHNDIINEYLNNEKK